MKFGQLWSRFDGSLFCFCVNRCVQEYATWREGEKEH